MKKIYVLLLLFSFIWGAAQNTEIKDAAGVVLPTPYYFCSGSNLNLQVDDYASPAGSTSGETTFSDFSLYTASTLGETDVTFSAATLIRDKFSYPIDLGFNFTFFNKTYTRLVVGSNGRLLFSNDPILDNLHDTSTFVDRTLLSPPIQIASPKYNQIYKTGDVTREVNMAQIFAGFTNLRINAATGKYIFKRFDIAGNKGIVIKFQSVVAHNGTGGDFEDFTSQVIIFDDGRVILNVKDKSSDSYNAILGMQNENGDTVIIAGDPPNPAFNNGAWISYGTDAYVITTGSARTPTYLWELDRNNGGTTVDETSNTRFFPNYSPISDIEKLRVKISFLETPEIRTSSIEFKKVHTPVIGKNVSGCAIILKVNSATFDAGLTYEWFRDGTPTAIPTSTNGQLVLNWTSVPGEYYAVAVKPDGTSCATISNKIEIKKFFPGLIKSQLTICYNSSSPVAATTVNLYSEFYPQYSSSSAFEEYEVDFFDSSGSHITNPANYSILRNQDISLTVRSKLKLQPTYCESDIIKINFIAIPNSISIPVCSSTTVYNLKNYFSTNFPASSHSYNFTYTDGSTAGDGSSVDVAKTVIVNTTVPGAICSTITQVTFPVGSSISVPAVPIQERCAGSSSNNADRFNFNFIKNILDPSEVYDVKFYNKSDNSEIIVGSGTGPNLNAAGYFWSNTTGDYIIYAKVSSRTDATCFAISADIILRVYMTRLNK